MDILFKNRYWDSHAISDSRTQRLLQQAFEVTVRGAQLTPAGRQRLTEAIKSNVSVHISLSVKRPHIHCLFLPVPLSIPPSMHPSVHPSLPPFRLISVYLTSFSILNWHLILFLYFLYINLCLHLSSTQPPIFAHHYTPKVKNLPSLCSFFNKERLGSSFLPVYTTANTSLERGVHFQMSVLTYCKSHQNSYCLAEG